MIGPWLSIVGVGEDGLDGLSPAARALLKQARLVVGGRRHLALAGPLEAETLVWPSPMDGAYARIAARRGEPVCVLASGDPFFYGVGSALTRLVDPKETICLPAPSAFSLAAARLGWAQQDCALISLHGRPLERIAPLLCDRARILALSWDGETPRRLAALLQERGFGRSQLSVCENLGGAAERIRAARADDFRLSDVNALNTIAIAVVADRGARVLARAPGLPDDWFEHDGQITKREIRALTLSALAPGRGELLWDVGAGSGSVAIEWMLADPANMAVAVERNEERAARIARNAAALGAPGLEVAARNAPEGLRGLAQPDAIFIGGGGAPAVVDCAIDALRPGGRLVVNAVTIERQAQVSARFRQHGGDLIQIQIARADAIGAYHALRPALPVLQWRYEKP